MGMSRSPQSDARMLEGASLPERLNDLESPPERLFLHGNLPSGPCIGVVGTRRASPKALEFAEKLSSSLASRGVAIISGGAKGIDAAAHRGALGASGTTLVVAASSLDCPFPAEHADLYSEVIATGGGYLSRFESGVAAQRHAFLDRNGILVALCDALVLVEAPLKSGARNATGWARQLGRPCFVVPSAPWNDRGRGCILELQLGGRALGGSSEILDFLDRLRVPASAPATASPAGQERARRSASVIPATAEAALPLPAATSSEDEMTSAVLAALARGARYADDVAEALGIGLSRVNHALLLLMLSGDIQQGAGGVLTRARR